MNDMQKFFDDMSKGLRAQRSLSQMTIEKLIATLEKFPAEKEIENIIEPHSYRGYYSDLAFEREPGTRTVGSLLEEVKGCLNNTFTGYKGGDFFMDIHTPLWIASYGSTGEKIVGLVDDGSILLFRTAPDDY